MLGKKYREVLHACILTHVALIMLLTVPDEARFGLLVGPLHTPLPVPNAQQTDVQSCHIPRAQFLTMQTAKEFRVLVRTCADFALLLGFGSIRNCL